MHIVLFLLTLAATTYAGHILASRFLLYDQPGGWLIAMVDGLLYAVPLLLFLTAHEFGHYFAARTHGVSTTLPFYIPSPLFMVPFNIGTFGAVIRIREPVPDSKRLFDIGIAGPLAGFVVALGILFFALATLPPLTYLYDLPGHAQTKAAIRNFGVLPGLSSIPAEYIGQTLLFSVVTSWFDNVPPMYEMYHYPVLFAAWLGLFFTALNLMPIGQLDGGHILFSLVGPVWHGRIARAFVLLLLLSASIGFFGDIGDLLAYRFGQWGWVATWVILSVTLAFFMRRIFPHDGRMMMAGLTGLLALVLIAEWLGPSVTQYGYLGWMLWVVLIVVFIKIDHPPVLYMVPLGRGRQILGVLSMVIFLLSFSIRPIYLSDPGATTPAGDRQVATTTAYPAAPAATIGEGTSK